MSNYSNDTLDGSNNNEFASVQSKSKAFQVKSTVKKASKKIGRKIKKMASSGQQKTRSFDDDRLPSENADEMNRLEDENVERAIRMSEEEFYRKLCLQGAHSASEDEALKTAILISELEAKGETEQANAILKSLNNGEVMDSDDSDDNESDVEDLLGFSQPTENPTSTQIENTTIFATPQQIPTPNAPTVITQPNNAPIISAVQQTATSPSTLLQGNHVQPTMTTPVQFQQQQGASTTLTSTPVPLQPMMGETTQSQHQGSTGTAVPMQTGFDSSVSPQQVPSVTQGNAANFVPQPQVPPSYSQPQVNVAQQSTITGLPSNQNTVAQQQGFAQSQVVDPFSNVNGVNQSNNPFA